MPATLFPFFSNGGGLGGFAAGRQIDIVSPDLARIWLSPDLVENRYCVPGFGVECPNGNSETVMKDEYRNYAMSPEFLSPEFLGIGIPLSCPRNSTVPGIPIDQLLPRTWNNQNNMAVIAKDEITNMSLPVGALSDSAILTA